MTRAMFERSGGQNPGAGGSAGPAPRRAHAGPAGKRCYAIGDVHGRLDLLQGLLARIEADLEGREAKETSVVFLGDLIDRGPSSSEVVEYAFSLSLQGAQIHYIMGNHEEMLVRGLRRKPEILEKWLSLGGVATAASYGLSPRRLLGAAPSELRAALLDAVPARHIDFLAAGLDYVRFGDFLLVHAGIRPGIPLDRQKPKDLRWIRSTFLNSDADHGACIVHGHSVEREARRQSNRLGLDTGAHASGVLTGARIEGETVEIIDFVGETAVEPA